MVIKKTQYKTQILDFFQENSVDFFNVMLLIKFLFETDCYKAQRVLSTRRIKILANVIIETINILDPLRSQIKNSLYDIIQSYRTKNGSRVHHAPLKCPLKLREAMHNLYYDRKSSYKYARRFSHKRLVRNQISALHALFSFLTGRRWIDISRIRWDNMDILRTEGKLSIKFYIACSKANQGKRNEGITLMADDSNLCPVKLVTEYWINSGRPKVGFVFNCLHKKAKFPPFEFCDQWLSRRCPGHKMGKKIFTCNGEINGDTTYGVF